MQPLAQACCRVVDFLSEIVPNIPATVNTVDAALEEWTRAHCSPMTGRIVRCFVRSLPALSVHSYINALPYETRRYYFLALAAAELGVYCSQRRPDSMHRLVNDLLGVLSGYHAAELLRGEERILLTTTMGSLSSLASVLFFYNGALVQS